MSDFNNPHFVDWMRHAAPYMNRHRQKTFVIALSGKAISSEERLAATVSDITMLTSLGIKVVIVFGVRPQLTSALNNSDISSTYTLNNIRVTTSAMMQRLWQVAGETSIKLQAAFSAGLPDSPMYGSHIKVVSTNAVVAKPIGVLDGIDYQHTGKVRRINNDQIRDLLENDNIVLVPPMGFSLTGETFNLEYLDLAQKIAANLEADKLIVFSKHHGIVNANTKCIREIRASEAQNLSAISNNQKKILQAATKACQGGVKRTHVVSYKENGSLLRELFTRDGCGTMISDDGYDQLRDARIEDISGIMNLLQPLESRGILVRRSRERLEAEISQFMVITRDNAVIGCAALYYFDKGRSAELACIVSHSTYKGQGLGERLLNAAQYRASTNGAKRLFVLTTQTAHWFLQHGFKTSAVDALPEDKKELYNFQRASKVFEKSLV